MYTSSDEYFYFRPRMGCSGNILPVRVDEANGDPSAPLRPLSSEDILYFYELAVTKIGLFRWAEDGFSSASGVRGYTGLGFPYPDPESGLDFGGVLPPYVPSRRLLLPDEPLVSGSNGSTVDPLGSAFGDAGLSETLVGMFSLLRDLALVHPRYPYYPSAFTATMKRPRRFRWDDVAFDADSRSNSWNDPSERIYRSKYLYVTPQEEAQAHVELCPLSAAPGTETDVLWTTPHDYPYTEEAHAQWFCTALETGRWLRDRAEAAELSLLEEMRAVPLRQELVKRMWLDLLYFDSVAVYIVPSAPYVTSSRTETFDSDGEFSWPEVGVEISRTAGTGPDEGSRTSRTFTLVGDFGYAPGSAVPVVEDTPAAVRGSGPVRWSLVETWSASRTYVTCCAATSWTHVVGVSGGVLTPSLDEDYCAGQVYTGMTAESYSVSSYARAPAGSSRSSFEIPLPPFPSAQLPFDPDLVDEARGYVTCYWHGYATNRSVLGVMDSGRGALNVPADPLTGQDSAVLPGGESSGYYLSWECGWVSAPASVEFDLGADGSSPVLRVSSSAVSSAISSAESVAGGCSIPQSGAVAAPSFDPLASAPVPADGYGRDSPRVVATYDGENFEASPQTGGDSLAEECKKYYASLSTMPTEAFTYITDPDADDILYSASLNGRTIECPANYSSRNGVFPDASSGFTTGDEFGVTAYVPGQGTQQCSGTAPFPGYNCVAASAGRSEASTSSTVSALASVTGLWLFVRFKPKCAAEIAIEALRRSCLEEGS